MAKDPEKHAELTEHLTELRTRLIRSVIYVAVATIVAWFFYDQIFTLLTRPMFETLKRMDTKFLLTGFPEAFMIRMQICVVSGIILCSPLVTFELWGFVAPGLTPDERRPVLWMAPLTVLLFAAGVVLCYLILPAAFRWFSFYVPKGAELRPSVQGSMMFTLKMLLAFGVMFELPIFLMLLAKIGIVNSRMLWENWRIAVVAIAAVAAVATPSNDALTMIIAAVPVTGLYFLGIILVKIVERRSPGG